MNTRCIQINDCGDCPLFDNVYYGYEQTCTVLDRRMDWSASYPEYPIPSDCPLSEDVPTDVSNGALSRLGNKARKQKS